MTAPTLAWALLLAAPSAPAEPPSTLDALNVVWDSPSQDSSGSMPLGNGEVSLNAWVDSRGDLSFYIGRIDSWSEGGHLLKVGKVRVSLTPRPLVDGAGFRQELNLREGTMDVTIDGPNPTKLRLWVDAHRPVVEVLVESEKTIQAIARIESWRTERYTPAPDSKVSDPYSPLETTVGPDVLLESGDARIGWYYHNAESFGPSETMRFQGLDGYAGFVDPLIDRTFGGVVTAEGGQRLDAHTLATTPSTRQEIRVCALSLQPSTPESWLAESEEVLSCAARVSLAERLRAHTAWWAAFWERSYVHISESGTSPRPVHPTNDYLIRVGFDQAGGNLFRGDFGRVALYPTAMAEDAIAALAQRAPEDLAAEGATYAGTPQPGTELPDSAEWDSSAALTLEAWVRPAGEGVVGRVLDKITPGGGDGFLFDTHPGGCPRLIVGSTTIGDPTPLPAGEWTHLAAVIANGGLRLYRDGVLVARSGDGESLSDAEAVSRGYALQRFITACAGRGRYPIKFNGSILTVPYPGRAGDADYRAWGPGYWWQNTRLPYISLCASGDFDLMEPLFRMYIDELLPMCEYRVRQYFGFEGAYFPECIHSWGAVFPETYGNDTPASEREDKLQTGGWHKWEWVSGLELAWMALDYAEYSGDDEFLRAKALPVARSVARFFENFYKLGDDGKLVMHPSQALETWWDVTTPIPEVAGLRAVAERILALSDSQLASEERADWAALLAKVPDLPTRETPDGIALAPGASFAEKCNIENPELYAVFPFRLVGVGREHLEQGINALHHRWDSGAAGWRQDDIFMAYLGLAEEARAYIVQRARTHHSGSRFPAFWGPNYDWIPDQDHGGVLMKAVQSLLMQTDGRTIYLLPAWPEGWNADFRLHAPLETVVEASVRDGEVVSLRVTPESRAADVVLCRP